MKVKPRPSSAVEASGWPVIDVSGGVTSSTIQVCESGVPSTLPASSTARTSKVCWPTLSCEFSYTFGLTQAVKAAPSRRHWKVSDSVALWLSEPVKWMTIEPAPIEVISVSGAIVSRISQP